MEIIIQMKDRQTPSYRIINFISMTSDGTTLWSDEEIQSSK